jgi:hypothetical protein
MESKLETLIKNLEFLSRVQEQSEDTPIVMRHTDTQSNKTIAIVCSQVEPINMVLPTNVIWVCFKPESLFYLQALSRISKDAGQFQQHEITQDWKVLYFYDDLFNNQTYNPDDLTLMGVGGTPLATVVNLGRVRLTQDPLDSNLPVAVVTEDTRMFDNRDPLGHTHAEIPATMLTHSTGHSNIVDSVAQIGTVLLHKANGDLEWARLQHENLI